MLDSCRVFPFHAPPTYYCCYMLLFNSVLPAGSFAEKPDPIQDAKDQVRSSACSLIPSHVLPMPGLTSGSDGEVG